MPTYEYNCAKCDKKFEAYLPMKSGRWKMGQIPAEKAEPAQCPTCGNTSFDRLFTHRVYFVGASVQHAEYNPAFGQVVKNKQHREELAKRRGLIEIGNEKTETIHKISETTQSERNKKSWDEV